MINLSSASQNTLRIYNSIPQYIQDWDSTNGYELLNWIDGSTSMLTFVDSFARDTVQNGEIIPGWSKLFNWTYFNNLTKDTASLDDVNKALVVLPWFAQFVGTSLQQIPSSIFKISQDTSNFITTIWPYIQLWLSKIINSNSFQRGTISSFLNDFAIFINSLNLANNVTANTFTVLEATKFVYTPNAQYLHDPYSLVILVPSQYIPNNSYFNVFVLGTPESYATWEAGYSIYNSIPNSTASLQNYLNIQTPAGVNVQIIKT